MLPPGSLIHAARLGPIVATPRTALLPGSPSSSNPTPLSPPRRRLARLRSGPMAAPLDPDLGRRLRECGIDPDRLADPAEAWRSLHERFGRRATLIDRYALEAACRGVDGHQLDLAVR